MDVGLASNNADSLLLDTFNICCKLKNEATVLNRHSEIKVNYNFPKVVIQNIEWIHTSSFNSS